ncbi:MAG: HlyD family efflux transporter periplasmic adaptor subunit [Candidatus Desantisbacteria bacterium]
MKKAVVIIISIILLGGIIFGMKSCLKKKDNSASKISTAVVKRGDIVIKVTEAGSVEPKIMVEVKSNVGGEIIRLPVKEGDRVRKGELLAELDTTELKIKLNQAKADLDSAEARLSTFLAGERPQEIAKARESLKQAEIRLADAKIKLDRQNGLFNQGFISKQEVETAQREYELAMSSYNSTSEQLSLILEGAREQDIVSARASVLKADAGYEQAVDNLNDAMIYAPLDGIILEKNVEEGEKITSGIGNNGGGTVILTIGDLSVMRILSKINEVDILKVKTGQAVEITLDALRGKMYHGKVTDIASLGKTENNIVTYEVMIEIVEREVGKIGRWEGRRVEREGGRRERKAGGTEAQAGYSPLIKGVRGLSPRQVAEGKRQRGIEYSTESRIPNPTFSDERLKPKMTANVDIITDSKQDALFVPLEAIVEHGRKKKILVLQDGKFIPMEIKTGLQDETRVEIIEGLSEGEKVKLNSLTSKKEKTGSSNRSHMSGRPPGMGGMGMGRR